MQGTLFACPVLSMVRKMRGNPMEHSGNAMIALRHTNRTFLKNGVALGALMLAYGLSASSAQAQTYQPSVEVDLSVLDSLGPAPETPSVDLYGSTTNQLDLYGTTQAPAAAVSEDSVLLLPAPEVTTTGTGSDSVLLLNQPATTATDDFAFPTTPEVQPEPVQTVITTTIVEPEPIALPEPEVMAEPESEILIAVPQTEAEVAAASASTVEPAADDVFAEIDDLLSEAAEPQDIDVPEPAMTMDGTDVAVVSTGDAALSGEDIRILFQPDDDALTAEDESVLRGLAGRLDAEPDRRIQLRAYASSEGTSASDARRLALSRALAVRAFLIENNVRSTRIDVRALGDKAESGPLDRIDIVLVER
jgi:outer membrane protein OmpA-like peptidoglycan-associated protein